MGQVVLLVAMAYLVGSIPTSYLAGRWLKGIDLRRYGSGTVSGTGVYYHVSRPAVVVVGLLDIAKVWLPTWLGLRWGLGLGAALAAGLAAMIGHNWPIYLHFHGGRGHSSILGVMLAVFPWGFPWLLAFMAAGRLVGQTALFSLAGIATLPLLLAFTGQPPAVIWASVAMLGITIAKRLEANRRPLPPAGPERRRVLLRRLLLDRDVSSRDAWERRPPADTAQPPAGKENP